MNSALIRFVASHAKNYPRGIPARLERSSEAAIPKVAFYSELQLGADERELLKNAAERGLQLGPGEYVIAAASETPRARTLVILGASAKPGHEYSKVIRTHAVSEVLDSPEKKRAFWEDIKRM